MERVAITRVTIRQSEVNCHRELDLAAAEDILQESVTLVELEVIESNFLIFCATDQIEFDLTLAQLCDVGTEVA